MTNRLKDKVALITGGCSGIGLATVELFIAEGANVVVADLLSQHGSELEKRFPSRLRFIHCDVTREEDIVAAVALAVDAFGGLDVTFNNAGAVGPTGGIEEMHSADWDRTMNLLLRSVMYGIKHSIAPMKKRGGGSIINTSSVAAVITGPAAYCVAKAAVIHLAHVAALELAPSKIRVNSVMPGTIATPISGTTMGLSQEKAEKLAAFALEGHAFLQPIPLPGRPQDIAEAVLYFASEAASFVTGTEIRVDGGLTLIPPTGLDPEKPGSIGYVMTKALKQLEAT